MDVQTANLTPPPQQLPTAAKRESQLPDGLADLLFGSSNIHHDTLAPPCARRSSRGTQSSLWELARCIVEGQQIVFITGAGMSVASGIRPFRTSNTDKNQGIGGGSGKRSAAVVLTKNKSSASSSASPTTSSSGDGKRQRNHHRQHKHQVEAQPLGIWNQVLWTQAKRESFRKDPLSWWNDFWLRYFPVEDYEAKYHPNAGHWTLAALQQLFPDNIKIITQNVDGLHHKALDAVAAWSRQQRKLRPRACKSNNQNSQRSRKPPKKRKVVLDSDEEEQAATDRAHERIIEAHGKLGFYKCIPDDDSDTDSSSDEDDDRLVHLGHRRKYRAWKRKFHHQLRQKDQQPRRQSNGEASSQSKRKHSVVGNDRVCRYQMLESLMVDQLTPDSVQNVLRPQPTDSSSNISGDNQDEDHEYDGDTDQDSQDENNGSNLRQRRRRRRLLKTTPRCPSCGNHVLPQALLFDEGYHSHDHYQFTNMEDWLSAAQVLVFCGTSFAVTLPLVALDHARDTNLPVYNFNVSDMLESTARLNSANIVGPSQETLPQLMQAVRYWVQQKETLGGVLP